MTTSTMRQKRRPGGRRGMPGWLRLLRGLGAALLVSLAGVAIFALLMQWIRPSETAVKLFNQGLKLVSICAGVTVAVGRGQEGGLLRGALVGLVYMAAGVGVYALLTGQGAPATAYLADLGMGVAAGGIVGMILSNLAAPR